MEIEYDPIKRATTLKARRLDMERAGEVFDGPHLTFEDDRQDYGEPRFITLGHLDGRMMVLAWTPRGTACRVMSMRKAMSANATSTAPGSGDPPDEVADDDLPDLSTPYWQERIAETPVRRGRPKAGATKVSTTIRLDPDVLDAFKAGGPGWQGRVNSALRKAARLS